MAGWTKYIANEVVEAINTARIAESFSFNDFTVARKYFAAYRTEEITAKAACTIIGMAYDEEKRTRNHSIHVVQPIQVVFQAAVDKPSDVDKCDVLADTVEEIREVLHDVFIDADKAITWDGTAAMRDEAGHLIDYQAIREESRFEIFLHGSYSYVKVRGEQPPA
ncbi:MAG: hypothetical protein KDA71_23655 [Planctomycetales bacterium]|nr:hypothetical protein [Planctomycetales bacterium]